MVERMDVDQLIKLKSHTICTSENYDSVVQQIKNRGIAHFNIRRECWTIDQFYDEITNELNLPEYFGRNLSALRDVLNDGDVVRVNYFLLLIPEGETFLSKETIDVFDGLVDTFDLVGDDWSLGTGWPWNIPPRNFHVLFFLRRDEPRYERISRVG